MNEMGEVTHEIETYFASLHSRRDEAKPVDPREVDGWEPRPSDCHNNVDYEVSRNPMLKAVRGWFVQPLEDDHCRYVSHAVVQDGKDRYDITPIDDKERPRFLEHIGTPEEFDRLKMTWTGQIYPFIFDAHLIGGAAQIPDPFLESADEYD